MLNVEMRPQWLSNIAQFDYTLNAVGNRTAKNASGAIPNVNESYTYDAIDQVTAVSKPGDTQTFAYDPTGNRTAVTSTGSSPGVGSYTTNALNQYSAAAGDVLLYDTKGNLTTQGFSASYSYDSKNRLLGATKGSNTMAVTYDYRNRPVSRSINGTATYFIYDGWSLIGEYNVSGALLQKYIHGVNIDEILAKIDSTGTVFYHQDGLGSTVALTNSSGALAESYQYDVFGKVIISDNSGSPIANSAYSNRFMFTGREWIAEVGLYDYRNRVYSADLGRFIQTDPIRFDAGDVNLYRYVSNNPINFVDPLGLETAVQIGMGTGATRNPFGHSAVATSGQGVHSFGTGTDQGSSFSDYMNSQAAYRDSMVYVLPTTPEQEKAINDYLNGLTDKLPKVPGKDSGDNCASRTSEALKKAGLDVGENGTPAELQRALEKMVKDGNGLRFSVPKGSTPSDAWKTFNRP